MVVVDMLHQTLQRQRDQQPDRDDEEVEKEIANSMDLLVRRMNVKHGHSRTNE
jgi:hypothetical protein